MSEPTRTAEIGSRAQIMAAAIYQMLGIGNGEGDPAWNRLVRYLEPINAERAQYGAALATAEAKGRKAGRLEGLQEANAVAVATERDWAVSLRDAETPAIAERLEVRIEAAQRIGLNIRAKATWPLIPYGYHEGRKAGLEEAAQCAETFQHLVPLEPSPKHVRGLKGSDVAKAIRAVASSGQPTPTAPAEPVEG